MSSMMSQIALTALREKAKEEALSKKLSSLDKKARQNYKKKMKKKAKEAKALSFGNNGEAVDKSKWMGVDSDSENGSNEETNNSDVEPDWDMLESILPNDAFIALKETHALKKKGGKDDGSKIQDNCNTSNNDNSNSNCNNTSKDKEEIQPSKDSQTSLGDPSGNDDAGYWDKWFETVSKGTRFEWYVSTFEIAGILETFAVRGKGGYFKNLEVLHGGSGNSEMIFDFVGKPYNIKKQTALDISGVAINEMNSKLEKLQLSSDTAVEFLLQDVLLPLPFEDESYDAWIDKGLIDAMFDSFSDSNQANIGKLFNHANRILRNDSPYICITLAEEHILKLFLHTLSESVEWSTLNIIALNPAEKKSALRPFAFVFVKSGEKCGEKSVCFYPEGETSTSRVIQEPTFECVNKVICNSRDAFKSNFEEEAKKSSESSTTTGESQQLSLIKLQIKPYESETDLQEFLEKLKSSQSIQTNFNPALQFKSSALVPLAFGIKRLDVEVIINTNQVDELLLLIEEEHEDEVQSVDLESCVMVGDIAGMVKGNIK